MSYLRCVHLPTLNALSFAKAFIPVSVTISSGRQDVYAVACIVLNSPNSKNLSVRKFSVTRSEAMGRRILDAWSKDLSMMGRLSAGPDSKEQFLYTIE